MYMVGDDEGNSKLPAICRELKIQSAAGVALVNSRDVAEMFGKEHRNVLRDIEALFACSDLSAQSWFRPVEWIGEKGGARRSFDLTRDGFTLLVMGWTGERAMQFKIRYIEAFNAMEAALRDSAPVTERALLHAVREIVTPLSVRFDSQDREIGEIKDEVTNLSTRMAALERKSTKRKPINDQTRAEHVDALARLGGRCPCCGLRDVVRDQQRLLPAEFDHFYANHQASPDHTWLICKPCHDDLSHGRVARDRTATRFKAYQELRRSLEGRQIALSLF